MKISEKTVLWLSFFVLILCTKLAAQIKPVMNTGTTRALVIGISDYQNELISLQYAHKDAEAFAHWLTTPAGGGLESDQIQVLLNEEATLGRIVGGLTWLVENSQAGDEVILYFSGHGDMETRLFNKAYLLTHEAPASTYMSGGALAVDDMQDIIRGLTEREVKVTLITDACRSGSLAGDNIEGSRATTEALMNRFEHTIKILSCQPSEYSQEGKQWGGGRGVFSYYLINGLSGLADSDENLMVSLDELDLYLRNVVPKQTAPETQRPRVDGNLSEIMAEVDPVLLANLRQKLDKQMKVLAAVEYRSLPTALPAKADTNILPQYKKFQEALGNGHLLYPEEGSAYALYLQLSKEDSLAELHGLMRRNLSAALQDEAQEAINSYLNTASEELAERWGYGEKYASYPEYLSISAELLGENNAFYPSLRARASYFIGLNKRLRGEKVNSRQLLLEAIENQEQALSWDENAAYAYNELGLLHQRLGTWQKAVENYTEAVKRSPRWALPLNNLFAIYTELEQYDSALHYGERALKEKPELVYVHNNFGWMYLRQVNYKKAAPYFHKAIELQPQYPLPYQNLGLLHYYLKEFEKAEKYLATYSKLAPRDANGWNDLGLARKKLGRFSEAEAAFEKGIEVDPSAALPYYSLGNIYLEQEREYQAAEELLLKYLEIVPGDADALFGLSFIHHKQGEENTAKKWLEKAFQTEAGKDLYKYLESEAELADYRGSAVYQELVRKYFSEGK